MRIMMQKGVQHTEIQMFVDTVGLMNIFVWRNRLGEYSITLAANGVLDDCQIEVPKEKMDAYHGWKSDEYGLTVCGAEFNVYAFGGQYDEYVVIETGKWMW